MFGLIRKSWTHSIRRQLMLGIALVHAVLMTIFVFDLVGRQRTFLHEQSVSNTLSLSQTLASNSVSWVLSNDVIGLEEVVNSQSQFPDLLYAMILSPHGKVLGHSDRSKVGMYIDDPISCSLINTTPSPQYLITNKTLVDISSPILANDHFIGWARVGISQEKINIGLQTIIRDGYYYTIFAIIVGSIFALLMARGLTLGIQHLVKVSDKIGKGDENERIILERQDELGQLANSLNSMLDSIISQKHKTEMEVTERKRAEKALQEAHDEMEKRVIERTADLRSEVNERQRLEDELIKEKDFLEAILNNIEDGIVACNSEGVLTVFNRASTKFHGLPLTELSPDQWAQHYDLYFADGQTLMTRNDIPLFKAFNGENIHNVEMVIAPKNGLRRILQASGQPLRDKNGNIGGAVVSMHDITERKQAEVELKVACEKLKELDRMKSMFIASMSHELRTPLNSILGFTSVVLDGLSGELNPKQKDQLNRVLSAAHHLLTLITDIIDISRIESGRVIVSKEKFLLNELVREAIDIIQPQLKQKGLAHTITVPPADLQMYTDRKRLLQCVLNLLSNAVKFTEAGTITITAQPLDKEVEIRVCDTGIGISEQDMNKLFQPFERIESHLQVKAGGTGLGLYLTQKLATDLLGGAVTMKSEPGQGSTFSIIIPQNNELHANHFKKDDAK